MVIKNKRQVWKIFKNSEKLLPAISKNNDLKQCSILRRIHCQESTRLFSLFCQESFFLVFGQRQKVYEIGLDDLASSSVFWEEKRKEKDKKEEEVITCYDIGWCEEKPCESFAN